MSDTPLVDVLSTHLPSAIGSNLLSQSRPALEAILAFALGADCPPPLDHARADWSRSQPAALNALRDALHPSHKRARDTHTPDDPAPKRPKNDDDDPPQFTLPSISTTSPVRKKVDVTIHARSIRFLNPSTRALEGSLPLASITRAFLLPTRGKSKPHWTVVLLTADASDKSKVAPQVIFGLDARTSTAFDTTTYASGTPAHVATLAKGTDTAPVLRALLVHVPVPLLEPSPAIFRSACASTPTAGIDAYLGAKAGTLWFLDAGILWGESKPCAFWAVGDLLPKDGVRLMSATGRTCSVLLARARVSELDDGDEGEETAFSMVDGREQDPIEVWVRHRKHLFGKRAGGTTAGGGGGKTTQVVNATVQGPAWDDSDPDDDDFEASSEDLEETDSDKNNEDGDDVEDSEDEASDQGSGSGEEEEEEELDEARHPLLRPGAVPRMSKAAVDAVVDMIHRDFVDDASEEEDELEE